MTRPSPHHTARLPRLSADAPRLIINADDYGYSPAVNRGIDDCINAGTVKATGILIHGDTHPDTFSRLTQTEVDVGVHLNLTYAQPLTPLMIRCLSSTTHRDKGEIIKHLLRRHVGADAIDAEWAAQIETATAFSVRPVFLNSHEHLHMLPGLYQRVVGLAKRFNIPWIRRVDPEWSGPATPGHWPRNLALGGCALLTRTRRDRPLVRFRGLRCSGRLTRNYLMSLLPTLKNGQNYELMCHPGQPAPPSSVPDALTNYHYWEEERRLLADPALATEITNAGIKLCSFSDLSMTTTSNG